MTSFILIDKIMGYEFDACKKLINLNSYYPPNLSNLLLQLITFNSRNRISLIEFIDEIQKI